MAALAAVWALGLGACGDSSGGSGGESEDRPQLSANDRKVAARITGYVHDWNVIATKWLRALNADQGAFLLVADSYTNRLGREVRGMSQASAQITNPSLQRLLFRISLNYTEELASIVDVANSLRTGERARAERALVRVQRRAADKLPIVNELQRQFPGLIDIGARP